MQLWIDDAYGEGERACRRGVPRDDNPHAGPYGNGSARAYWDAGWLHAKRSAKREGPKAA